MRKNVEEFNEWFKGFRERQTDWLREFKPNKQDREIWSRTKQSMPISVVSWYIFFYVGWLAFLWIYSMMTSGFDPQTQYTFMESHMNSGIYMILGTIPVSIFMAIMTTLALLNPFTKLLVTLNSIYYGMILFAGTTQELQKLLGIDPNVMALCGGLIGLLAGMMIFNRMEYVIGIGWDGNEYVIYYDEYYEE